MKHMNSISYKELLNRVKELERIQTNGIQLVYSKSLLKLGLGISCLVIAIIPNGLGLVFYPLGFYLLYSSGFDLCTYARYKVNRFKLWVRWLK